jgi:DNA repair protein RadC
MKQQDIKPVMVYKFASLQLNYVLHDQYKRMSDLPRITDSHEAVTYLQEHFRSLNNAQEFFTIVLLNRANRILALSTIGQGNKHSTIVDISYIATLSLSIGANSIILCHNHPSGNYFPSEPDKELTRKIKAALQLLDIELTDHIILTSDDDLWYSFASNGEI